MKRVFYVVVTVCVILLGLSGCGDKEEPGSGQLRLEGDLQKAPERAASGKGRGLGMVREPSRLRPGWECPTMPGIKSAYPGNCPGTAVAMVRKGEWTCREHPQVSGLGPGKCPLDGTDLVKVADVEKEMGKSIAELTKEYLAAPKPAQE